MHKTNAAPRRFDQKAARNLRELHTNGRDVRTGNAQTDGSDHGRENSTDVYASGLRVSSTSPASMPFLTHTHGDLNALIKTPRTSYELIERHGDAARTQRTPRRFIIGLQYNSKRTPKGRYRTPEVRLRLPVDFTETHCKPLAS